MGSYSIRVKHRLPTVGKWLGLGQIPLCPQSPAMVISSMMRRSEEFEALYRVWLPLMPLPASSHFAFGPSRSNHDISIICVSKDRDLDRLPNMITFCQPNYRREASLSLLAVNFGRILSQDCSKQLLGILEHGLTLHTT